MGLLDGISAGLTAATKAATGAAEGQQKGSALLRAMQMQMLDTDAKRSTIALNTARAGNFDSERQMREHPLPKKVYDPTRGVMVDEGAGSATPVSGLPDKPVTAKYTPHAFMENGKPVLGLVTEDGTFLHADRTPVTGSVTPFEKPDKPEKELPPQLITSVGPDGKPVYGVFDKGTRTIQPVDASGLTPKGPAAGGGQNAPQMAASKANLDASRRIMDEYEAKMKTGKAHIGVLGASEGAMAASPDAITAHGPLGAAMSVVANAAGSHLQHSDPELARYLTAKKYVAEAILNTHKRPNQTQYEIEQELSGAGPGASNMQIDMGKERRDRMYNEVFANPAAGAVSGSAPQKPAIAAHPSPTYPGRAPLPQRGGQKAQKASEAQTLWDAAVALHGRDKVLAEFGPRPNE